MSRIAITLKLKMLWLPNEARYGAVKLQTDKNIPSLIPHKDKKFGGSLVLDFGKRWRHVKTIYTRYQNKLDSGREIQKSKLQTQKISLEFYEHKY